MKIAIVGLGKMGFQIAKMVAKKKHTVIAVDPNVHAVKATKKFGAYPATSREDALQKFGKSQVVVWLMIPAAFVTSEVEKWLAILPKGSILIDGGNTDFRETKKHAMLAKQKSVAFVDVGVSGGILGLKNGFSMMVGGDEQAYKKILPVLRALCGPHGGESYFGEAGSGHYVKMVHNAIEYGMMESLAEGYAILKSGPYQKLDLAKAGRIWQKASVIESTLNGLLANIMKKNPNLIGVQGFVAESGEARWTLEVAKENSVKAPAIQSAFDARIASQKGDVSYTTKLLAQLRNEFGGHKINK